MYKGNEISVCEVKKMYLWRFTIAILLGLVWYFSDRGRVVTQYVLGFLCFFAAPHVFNNLGRESGTQTDEVAEEKDEEISDAEHFCISDETDNTISGTSPEPHYPHVKTSLLQVFECAYAQLVVPWYGVPEPSEGQPLHGALWREFDHVFDRLISRARDFDVCSAGVGCIRVLTQHVHGAKQPDREALFNSREEEVAVLRVFSDALVRNLFTESIRGQEVSGCALNEMVALKVLELLVTWLSDPDNLNQLVVSQLDGVTPVCSADDLCDPERASPTSQEDEDSRAGGSEDEAEESAGICGGKSNKRANKLKEGWSKFVDKMKSKRAKKKQMKKMEQELMFRVMAIQGGLANEEEASSREGSVHSLQDSDSEDSDLESYLAGVQEDMMEFKLSYEMWRVGHWAVSVPHVERECEKLWFSVHLEEKDNPENLHWDVRKTHTDVIHFRNRWQDAASWPSLSVLEVGCEWTDETAERARTSLEHFLQELLSDDLIGLSQPVFQFLCPLDKLMNEEVHYGGVWGLLSGLAFFLTPGQEEDEQNGGRAEDRPCDLSSACPETLRADASEAASDDGDPPHASLPTILVSECDPPSESWEEGGEPAETIDAASSSQDKTEDPDNPITSHLKMIFKGLTRSRSEESLVSVQEDQNDLDGKPTSSPNGGSLWNLADSPSWLHFGGRTTKTKDRVFPRMSVGMGRSKRKDQGTLARGEEPQGLKKDQSSWENMEATKAIFDLLKEISGNSILMNIFDAILKPVMPILKKKVNSFLDKMNPTEAQMASYIDNLREKQWPDGCPAPARPHRSAEEKNDTRDRAHQLINARYSNYLVLKKTDMETVFKLFQDGEENKKLVYMLLSFLLRELLPDEDVLRSAPALQKVNAN